MLFFESVNKKDLQLQIIVKQNSTKLENLKSDTSIDLFKTFWQIYCDRPQPRYH